MPTAQTAGTLIVKLLGDASGYQKMLKNAQAQAAAFGKAMSMYVTAPLAAVGAVAVREFAKFDQAMTEATSIMKVTAAQVAKMRDTALELSKVSKQGPDELARSYYYLASAGFTAEQAMKALPAVAAFATAGAFDMARATELLADSQSALGLKSADAVQNLLNLTRVSDVLVEAANRSNASVEQFAAALTSKSGAAMRIYKKDVEEGVAVLAAYADQGVKGDLAGESFNRVLSLLSKSALENAAAFKKYNVTVFDSKGKMKNMADIVEDLEQALKPMSDQMRTASLEQLGFTALVQGAILPLIGTSGAIRDYERQLRAAGGTTQEVAEKQMQSFSNEMAKLKNTVIAAAIQIGETLAPMLKSLGVQIKAVADWWSKLDASTQKNIVTWSIYIAALGPGILIVSKLIGVVTSLGTAMNFLASGTIAAQAGIVGIALAATALGSFAIYKWRMKEYNDELERFNKLSGKVSSNVIKRQDEARAQIMSLTGLDQAGAIQAARDRADSERGQDPGGILGEFCASWLRFSKKIPSKSLIA